MAKGITGLEMHESDMLPRQQSMRLCPRESGSCWESERLGEGEGEGETSGSEAVAIATLHCSCL